MGTTIENDTINPEHESKPSHARAHVVIFPYMAKGHTIPLLHLSAALTRRNIRVTFITTPANSPFYHQYLHLPQPDVRLLLLPFPVTPSIPDGCESTDHLPSLDLYLSFLEDTTLLDRPFRSALQRLSDEGDLPLCVISDFFCGWTLRICEEFGVPRLAFSGMGVFSMGILKTIVAHGIQKSSSTEEIHLPGVPNRLRLRYCDVSVMPQCEKDQMRQLMKSFRHADGNSWGAVFNSFDEMERDHVSRLQSFYTRSAKVWLVGPLAAYDVPAASPPDDDHAASDVDPCLKWLHGKEPKSILYVSFGTQAEVPDSQLDEIAHGLAASGHEFLWVVRSPTWMAPGGVDDKGMIHRGWASQKDVLRHEAVGGVLSHCGWNSVMESVAAGVPVLAWPMMAEQALNAKNVVEELGAGLALEGVVVGGGLVRREGVSEGVRELMGGRKGREAREKAAEWGRLARSAVLDGGSSCRTLDALLEELQLSKEQRSIEKKYETQY